MSDRSAPGVPRASPSDNVDQLRHDIDSGVTGDKVKAFDPAAAPLGTDEEAAGTPPAPEATTAARRIERGRKHVSAAPAQRFPVWWVAVALVPLATLLIILISGQ
jgi:hypothetical protein